MDYGKRHSASVELEGCAFLSILTFHRLAIGVANDG